MIHLRSADIQRIDPKTRTKFPFSVPVIQSLEGSKVEFTTDVTFLVGENGSGKSTFLEALAVAIGSTTVGSDEATNDLLLAPVRPLARKMKLAWTKPAAAEQRPPCSEGGVPLPAARSDAREGGSGKVAQGDVLHLNQMKVMTMNKGTRMPKDHSM